MKTDPGSCISRSVPRIKIVSNSVQLLTLYYTVPSADDPDYERLLKTLLEMDKMPVTSNICFPPMFSALSVIIAGSVRLI